MTLLFGTVGGDRASQLGAIKFSINPHKLPSDIEARGITIGPIRLLLNREQDGYETVRSVSRLTACDALLEAVKIARLSALRTESQCER